MSTSRIDSSQASVSVENTRDRQTQRPATPFRDVLAGGIGILMTGAEAATTVVGGPVLAAAVRGARADVVGSVGATGPEAALASGAAGAASAGATAAIGGSPLSEMGSMQAMQRESQAFNLQLINLQEDIQKESRQFTTVSNVMRAKHDTAKAAIGNIRS